MPRRWQKLGLTVNLDKHSRVIRSANKALPKLAAQILPPNMTQGLLKDSKEFKKTPQRPKAGKMNWSSRTRQALCEAMWTLPMDDLTSNIAVSVCSRRSCSLSSLGIYSPWVRQPNLSRLTIHDMSRRPSHVGNVQTCS